MTARYPIPPVEAAELLERWAEEGRVVRVSDPGATAVDRWAERENLAEMRRVTVAVRRRESLAVAPEVFADFLLRRQHVHPATVGEGSGFVEVVLEQFQGFAAPAASWEKEILPRRVKGYRPGLARRRAGPGDLALACAGRLKRKIRASRSSSRDSKDCQKPSRRPAELSADEQALLDLLDRQGRASRPIWPGVPAIEPSRVRKAHWATLMNRGLVTNDRFDPLRAGSQATLRALPRRRHARRAGKSFADPSAAIAFASAEGRWSRLNAT